MHPRQVRRGYPKGSFQLDEYAYGYNDNYGSGRQAKEFNLKEIWRKVRKHKWLILAVTVGPSFVTEPVVYRGPYEYSVPGSTTDFTPRFEPEHA